MVDANIHHVLRWWD